jgi:hypothetical protein
MKTKQLSKMRNLPFTVTYIKDGVKVKKRFDDSPAAWSFMRQVNGQLTMAFRVFN